MALTHDLAAGPLLAALSPGATGLRVTATASGALQTPTSTITMLYQSPVLLTADPSSTILVLVGALRRVVVLSPTADSPSYARRTFILPGTLRLTPTSLSLTASPSSITLLDKSSDFTLRIHYSSALSLSPDPRPAHDAALFRPLLRSLDTLADAHHLHRLRSARLDALIATLSAFLASPARLTSPPSISSTPATAPPPHPPPLRGRLVYLNIALSPTPPNFLVRCAITPLTPRRSTLHTPPSAAVVVATLPAAPALSFPLALASHAPLAVNLALEAPALRLPLAAATLDVLDFSAPAGPRDDSSHRAFAPFTPPPAPSHSTTRLRLPQADVPLPRGGFVTPLGASFSVAVAGPSIAVHAAPHVAPFVRAALLRRALRGELAPVPLGRGAEIGMWKRRLVDGVDAWLPSFRSAEEALVSAREVFERVEGGEVELLYDRGEQVVRAEAVEQARASYKMLRRRLEEIW